MSVLAQLQLTDHTNIQNNANKPNHWPLLVRHVPHS